MIFIAHDDTDHLSKTFINARLLDLEELAKTILAARYESVKTDCYVPIGSIEERTSTQEPQLPVQNFRSVAGLLQRATVIVLFFAWYLRFSITCRLAVRRRVQDICQNLNRRS